MPSAPDSQVDVFARLLGRQPSEHEVARLLRVKDVLKLGDNDALWLVLMTLENYDAEMRRYPALLGAEAERVMAGVRTTIAQIASDEAKRAQHGLAESLATTTAQLAKDRAGAAIWLAVGWSSVALAVLVGISLTAGFVLASGRAPFWANPVAVSPALSALRFVLMAPAGWLAVIAAGVCIPLTWWRRLSTKPSMGQLVGIAALAATALLVASTFFVA